MAQPTPQPISVAAMAVEKTKNLIAWAAEQKEIMSSASGVKLMAVLQANQNSPDAIIAYACGIAKRFGPADFSKYATETLGEEKMSSAVSARLERYFQFYLWVAAQVA